MRVPSTDTLLTSAIAYLRETGCHSEADLLLRCKVDVSSTAQPYTGTTVVGLNITLRCRANDVALFTDTKDGWDLPSNASVVIQKALGAVLPAELKVHEMSARAILVDRSEFDKSEFERLIEAQMDLMIAVATGGPRIQAKNDEYKNRRAQLREKLGARRLADPNPFADLWDWYARWSGGDFPSYQSRREYVRGLYRPLLEELAAGDERPAASEPGREPTGWEKVDRVVDRIIAAFEQAKTEEDFQGVGLLCRECLISLAQAVFDPARHSAEDGKDISPTDAYRMLEAYFSSEYQGQANETLRRHAKASLGLANALQHKRSANRKDAALCREATRTVVNIVAITSGRR